MSHTLFKLRGLDDLGLEVTGDIVGRRSVIGGITYTITARWVVGVERFVERYVIEIYTKTVPLRRVIGKETDLENWESCHF